MARFVDETPPRGPTGLSPAPGRRSGPLRSLAGLAVLALLGGCSGGPAAERRAPRHLILVTLDTLRADHLGAYGYGRPTSPELDAFAAEAVRFADVTCSMPTTLPSHVTILTGLPPSVHGVRANADPPAEELVSVFELLAERGFATHAVVGSRVLRPVALAPLGLGAATIGGLTDDVAPGQVDGSQVTAAVLEWIRGRAPGERLAVWAHYFDAHEPYSPPPDLAASFTAGYSGELGDRLETRWLIGLRDEPPGSPEDVQHVIDLYDAEIAHLDRQLGALFDGLRDAGVLDEAVVVVVGDHGQAHGERGFWGHGFELLEPVVRVPLIVRLPGTAPRVVEAPVETLDVAPTLIELFGLEAPTPLPGRSLLPALAGEPFAGAEVRIVERRSYRSAPRRAAAALHGGDWKLVYERDADGVESVTLGRGRAALDGPDVFTRDAPEARLLPTLRALAQAAEAPEALSEEDRRLLESLGYLE